MNIYENINKLSIPIVSVEGDFTDKDGYLCCGVCKQHKEYRRMYNGREIRIGCACACIEKAKQELEKQERFKRLREQAFPTDKFYDMTFENAKVSKYLPYAVNFAKYFDVCKKKGQGLYIWGNSGSGKTYIAACIVNQLCKDGYTCKFTDISTIARESITGSKDEYLKKLLNCDLLVLDDFGVERRTEYLDSIIYDIINARYNQCLPLIITTNLNYEHILKTDDSSNGRIYSRIKEMCFEFKLNGVDMRTVNLNNSIRDMERLLKGEL